MNLFTCVWNPVTVALIHSEALRTTVSSIVTTVVTGGVAGAVVEAIGRLEPGREVKVVSAEGLQECKKMLMLAKAGKYDGYLLEGMACPGGCVAGAGTIQPVAKSIAAVGKYSKAADKQNALDSDYEMDLPMLD